MSASSAPTLSIGLQEWQVCCDALVAGRLILAVRKGGIHERQGGLFTPEHHRFALLPTWLHQDAHRLRPPFTDTIRPPPPAGTIPVPGWCSVERVWRVAHLPAVQALGAELAWTDAELATRFAYRDQPFLFVLALRAWRFASPLMIADEPAYAGCRSWIALRSEVPLLPATPAVSDTDFARRLSTIAETLAA